MSALTATLASRRGAVIAIGLALAAAVGIAVYNGRDMFRPGPENEIAGAFRNGIAQGVDGLKAVGDTVASLFESRSPGERAEGVLASLKQRRPALHQRALPKVRRPPASPLAGIVGAAPIPPVLPPVTPGPLYNVINGGPAAPVALTPSPAGPGGFFPGISLPGGGGGGIIVPPPAIVTPPDTPVVPVTPVTPVTPAIPEPSTWAMMLLGFAMIGSAVARKARPLPQASHS